MSFIIKDILLAIFDHRQTMADGTSHEPVVVAPAMDADAEYFKEFLLGIYQCSKPFNLEVAHTKPKTRMGTYTPRTCRIRINDGWGDTEFCKEIAIHEYAHHIHFTEKGKTRKKEDPHGKEFWQIYGQLILLAKQKGLYNHPETIGI